MGASGNDPDSPSCPRCQIPTPGCLTRVVKELHDIRPSSFAQIARLVRCAVVVALTSGLSAPSPVTQQPKSKLSQMGIPIPHGHGNPSRLVQAFALLSFALFAHSPLDDLSLSCSLFRLSHVGTAVSAVLMVACFRVFGISSATPFGTARAPSPSPTLVVAGHSRLYWFGSLVLAYLQPFSNHSLNDIETT